MTISVLFPFSSPKGKFPDRVHRNILDLFQSFNVVVLIVVAVVAVFVFVVIVVVCWPFGLSVHW